MELMGAIEALEQFQDYGAALPSSLEGYLGSLEKSWKAIKPRSGIPAERNTRTKAQSPAPTRITALGHSSSESFGL